MAAAVMAYLFKIRGMIMDKVFYQLRMHESEEGIAIVPKRFISVHETEHFNFCVNEYEYIYIKSFANKNEPLIKAAKRRGNKVFRISKVNSRIAFESEEKAFQNLTYRKRLQVKHLERNLAIVKRFLSEVKGKNIEDFPNHGLYRVFPDTEDIINEYFRFD